MKNKKQNNGDIMSDLIFGGTDEEKRNTFKNAYEKFLNKKKDKKSKTEKKNTEIKMNNFNTDTAWNNLHKRIEEDGLSESQQKEYRIKRFPLMKAAAVIILLISFSFIGYLIFNTDQAELIVAETTILDEVKDITLSDGTVVSLNTGSMLIYPEEFENNIREVKIEGEAFFHVKRNTEKPFIVHTKDANIKVLGTSFNVNTKFNNNKVEVTVKTGKVQLYSKKDTKESEYLEPGYLGTYENKKVTKSKNTEKNYLAWKTHNFIYKREKLSKIIEDLNKVYRVNIEFDNEDIGNVILNNCEYQDLPIDSILELICFPYEFKTVKKDNRIIIK